MYVIIIIDNYFKKNNNIHNNIKYEKYNNVKKSLGWVSAQLIPRMHAIHITSIPPSEKYGHIMQQFDISKDAAKDCHEREASRCK